jgi:hypothetical protein
MSKSTESKKMEDFEGFRVGETPKSSWKSRGGRPEEVYAIAKEASGNKYLKAVDHGQSVQFFRKGGWDIKEYPFLSWKWRGHVFPLGSDERSGKTNDSVAAVYVLFPTRFFIPEAIKYIWSLEVKEGNKIARNERFPMIVTQSGNLPKGEWVLEVRNVKEDYERHFGRKAPDPVAIGFLTDANAMKSNAAGDYDDFIVWKKPPTLEANPKESHPSSNPSPSQKPDPPSK